MHRALRGLRVASAMGVVAAASMIALWAAPSPSALASPSSCAPGNLEMVSGEGDAGLGHWSETVLIVHPGAGSCSLRGYPTVRAFIASTHRWVAARRTTSGYLGGLQSGQSISTVTVGTYTVASFTVEGTDVPVGGATSCPSYERLTVALPGSKPSVNLSFGGAACSPLQVHPFVAGATGNQPPNE